MDISFIVTEEVVNVSFDLNCTSQGGPVKGMLWLHENEPINHTNHFPTLADAKIGLYYNFLSVHGRMTGTYTCRITDEMNNMINDTSQNVQGKNHACNRLLTIIASCESFRASKAT